LAWRPSKEVILDKIAGIEGLFKDMKAEQKATGPAHDRSRHQY
jgi:hypothetical protein